MQGSCREAETRSHNRDVEPRCYETYGTSASDSNAGRGMTEKPAGPAPRLSRYLNRKFFSDEIKFVILSDSMLDVLFKEHAEFIMSADGRNIKTEKSNITTTTEFILLGFSDVPHLKWILFGIFFLVYLCIVMCNSIVILVTRIDPALQTAMYFFLNKFSFVEICYVTVTIPRMLVDICAQKGNISLLNCAIQMWFFLLFAASECFLLTVMAYDRYVAICKPLLYALMMNHRVCVQLLAACWASVIPVVTGQTYLIFSLPFCGSNRINHFFCDIPPILSLACGDTFVNNLAIFTVSAVTITIPFLLIIVSYGKIICSILKLSSTGGRSKAFSTCSSHLMVVVLFYGTAAITYIQPKANASEGIGKLVSLFYSVLIPLLNPIIYTLRNKEISAALRKLPAKLLT
ncbi:olfactory receptor 10AG1-like [Nannospalax galili]|uniref:olfactory receptor 10AG1-like n=1 Tax=Nannospalax galili TaxID=1026970 RepID=UPI00081A0B63|nr:olfactory receptor 10AG1-like [Nannospalax galili]